MLGLLEFFENIFIREIEKNQNRRTHICYLKIQRYFGNEENNLVFVVKFSFR